MNSEFDVICIGAGPAGEALTAALHGSGLSLAVVENERVGGECAYWGCMPSKTQIRSAETLTEAGRARELAASRVEWTVDFDKVAKRVKWMTRDLDDAGAAKALEDKGARVVRGTGRLIGPRTVAVDGDRLTASRAIVIATGTKASAPPIPGLDGVDYWTNREAVQAVALPRSLVVIGGGAVGVELGQAFARFGTRVHIIEASDRVVSLEEPEAGAFLGRQLEAEGIHVVTGAKIASVEKVGVGVRLRLQSGETIEAERLLIAAGRRPSTEGFDLEAAGVKTNSRGFIQVDPATLIAGAGIYAAGDINGIGGFTHLADYQGTRIGRAIRDAAGSQADHRAVPRVTFTDPEIGSVGMSERQAAEKGIRVETASADVGRTARGYIHGEPGGLIKLVADRERKVLVGATIVSPRAGEMLSELSLALKLQVPISSMEDLVHPFPTFSRVLQWMFAELGSKLEEPVKPPA
jgi:pyruvate/2-oxoglutarate dehydrogenase complex dihydrolipoamide dehydrogenase (E3) component